MKETKTMMRSGTTNGCPYAVALHLEGSKTTEDDDDFSSIISSSSEEENWKIRQCPAFETGSCPFRDAKTADEVRETLLKVPKSHYEEDRFVKVLEGLHILKQKNDNDTTNEQVRLPPADGCPVTQNTTTTNNSQRNNMGSFIQKLESMSSSVIMALEMERNKKEQQQEKDHTEEDHTEEDHTEEEDTEEEDSNEKEGVITTSTTDVFPPLPTDLNRSVSLSESLKAGTAVSHQNAEDVHFVRNFIQGKIDRKAYAILVQMLYHVYEALEDCLDKHASKYFPTCHFPNELRRLPALQEDLDFWHGATSAESLAPTPATRDYMDRLRHIAETKPLLLLSHAYTRYLGDLSGGKILARVARKAMNLEKSKTGGNGLDFYHFEHIPSAKKFKDVYRLALDNLPLTVNQVQELVAEANVSFCLNMRLFEELDVMANVPGAKLRPLKDALVFEDYKYDNKTKSEEKEREECPFAKIKTAPLATTLTTTTTAAATDSSKRCPWPFVFCHDPKQGMKDWQTWLVIGLILSWIWNTMVTTTN